jgi:hypothetical protein
MVNSTNVGGYIDSFNHWKSNLVGAWTEDLNNIHKEYKDKNKLEELNLDRNLDNKTPDIWFSGDETPKATSSKLIENIEATKLIEKVDSKSEDLLGKTLDTLSESEKNT